MRKVRNARSMPATQTSSTAHSRSRLSVALSTRTAAMLAPLISLSSASLLIAWANNLPVAKNTFELAWQHKKDGECCGEHFINSGARLSGVQLRTSLRMRVSASQPCAITARCKCCQSGNTVGVRVRALVGNSSPRVGGARDVNNLSHGGRVQFQRAGRRDARSYRNSFMCTRREGTIAGALGHSLLELILLRRGERRECDA